jgi:hypothetical protein
VGVKAKKRLLYAFFDAITLILKLRSQKGKIMADAKTSTNYTAEMIDQITEMYEAKGNDGLEQIAEAVGRSVRSVRSKLVTLGVYVKQDQPAKVAKREGPTKKELLNALEAIVPFEVDGLMGATKSAITDLIDYALSVQSQGDTAEVEPEADEAAEVEAAEDVA